MARFGVKLLTSRLSVKINARLLCKSYQGCCEYEIDEHPRSISILGPVILKFLITNEYMIIYKGSEYQLNYSIAQNKVNAIQLHGSKDATIEHIYGSVFRLIVTLVCMITFTDEQLAINFTNYLNNKNMSVDSICRYFDKLLLTYP